MSGTMDNVTSWQPTDETPLEVLNDAVNLIASTTINGVAFGVVLTLYCVCIHALVQQIRAGTRKNQAIFHLVYISIMVGFGTVYCAVNSRIAQLAYVNDRNFPGGPALYSIFVFSTPINIAGAVAFFITSWMNDALLVWRLWVLYRGSRFSTLITTFALILYLATFSMAMVTLIESVLPNQSFWSAIAVKFGLAYYTLTTSYTIVITSFMIARILHVRKAFITATGRSEYGSQYLSIAAMLVESSALYTIWGIIFLGLYIVNHPVQYVFLASLSEVQIVAPLLIIYRVSIGKAWQSDTTQALSKSGISQRRMTMDGRTAVASGATTERTFNNIHISVDKVVSHESSFDRGDYELKPATRRTDAFAV